MNTHESARLTFPVNSSSFTAFQARISAVAGHIGANLADLTQWRARRSSVRRDVNV